MEALLDPVLVHDAEDRGGQERNPGPGEVLELEPRGFIQSLRDLDVALKERVARGLVRGSISRVEVLTAISEEFSRR
jgi:hypothetical protein